MAQEQLPDGGVDRSDHHRRQHGARLANGAPVMAPGAAHARSGGFPAIGAAVMGRFAGCAVVVACSNAAAPPMQRARISKMIGFGDAER